MNLKGTKTAENLMKAFAGESQARNRYTFYASKAKKEGFVQAANIFEITANQEKEHAKRLFKYMDGDVMEITDSFPFGVIGSTVENLKAAAAGENHEYEEMYPHMADVAEEEGFEAIAEMFRSIGVAESLHEQRFLCIAKNIEDGSVFKKDQPAMWYCQNCGYVHEGEEAPKVCPACNHVQAHFCVLDESWI